jgi:hypothetical protein
MVLAVVGSPRADGATHAIHVVNELRGRSTKVSFT